MPCGGQGAEEGGEGLGQKNVGKGLAMAGQSQAVTVRPKYQTEGKAEHTLGTTPPSTLVL